MRSSDTYPRVFQSLGTVLKCGNIARHSVGMRDRAIRGDSERGRKFFKAKRPTERE